MDLVEQLRLEDPLLLLGSTAEAVDLVPERAVAVAVEALDDARGELLVGRRPRDALVQIDEVALVDARRRRVDDDEHLGGEVLALAVEDDAGHVHRLGLGGALLHVEVERREAVLAVDDEVLATRLLEVAHVVERLYRLEAQHVGREQQHRAGDRRLAHDGVVEVADRRNLAAGQLALERRVRVLDLGDEAGDLVVRRPVVGGEALLPLGVKPGNEANAIEQILGPVGREVKDAVFLAYLRGEHGPGQDSRSRARSAAANLQAVRGRSAPDEAVVVAGRGDPGIVPGSGHPGRRGRHAALLGDLLADRKLRLRREKLARLVARRGDAYGAERGAADALEVERRAPRCARLPEAAVWPRGRVDGKAGASAPSPRPPAVPEGAGVEAGAGSPVDSWRQPAAASAPAQATSDGIGCRPIFDPLPCPRATLRGNFVADGLSLLAP